MSDLIDTTEMYLKSIWEMDEDGIVPLRARLAERLGQSGPTVSQTVARMERDGLVALGTDRIVEFTALGRGYAMRVMRKHRLCELLLLEILGLDFTAVHEEACRWEHVVGRTVEERIVRIVSDPQVDPYGNPIPGLGELGLTSLPVPRGVALADSVAGPGIVVRIGEPLQADAMLLRRVQEGGVLPGSQVEVEYGEDGWSVRSTETGIVIHLPITAARHLFLAR